MYLGRGPSRVQDFLLQSLRPSTVQKYTRALEDLNNELRTQGYQWHDMDESQQDNFIAEWLIDGFEAGAGKAEYGWALSAVQKIYPRLRLKTAWRVFDVWGQHQPPKQAPAATPEFLHAMMAMSLFLVRPQVAGVMVFCYAGLLRVREALSLKHADIILQKESVTFCLGQTKRGIEQKVVMRNTSVVSFTVEYIRRFPGRHSDALFNVSYSSFLRWVKRLSWLLGGEEMIVSTHTFRRSGASELSRMGMPLLDILLYGRWSTERAAREYTRQGEVAVHRSRQAQQGMLKQRVDRWAHALSYSWSFFDAVTKHHGVEIPSHRLTKEKFDLCEKAIFQLLNTYLPVRWEIGKMKRAP